MYYLIMTKHSFSPKMHRKNFENRFTNKNLMSKNVFEYGLCIGKGDNPKIFNFIFWQNCQFYSNVWTPGKLFLQFGVGLRIFNKILELFFFFFQGKIVTSLANNYTMQKSLFKYIFGR